MNLLDKLFDLIWLHCVKIWWTSVQ